MRKMKVKGLHTLAAAASASLFFFRISSILRGSVFWLHRAPSFFCLGVQARGVSELQQQVAGVVERLREAERRTKAFRRRRPAVKPVFQQDQEAVGVVLCRSLPFCLRRCYGLENGQKSGGC